MTSVDGFIEYKSKCSSGSYEGDTSGTCSNVFKEMLVGFADTARYGPADALTGSHTVLRKFDSNQEPEAGLMVTFFLT
jgi:hypothetical protein